MTTTDPHERDLDDLLAVFRLLDRNRRDDLLFFAARLAGAECPSWCRQAGAKPDDDGSAAHDFDILFQGDDTVIERAHDTDSETMQPADATASSQWIYVSMVAYERLTDSGPVVEPAKLQISVERSVTLTVEELDELLAMLGRWRQRLELANQAQR